MGLKMWCKGGCLPSTCNPGLDPSHTKKKKRRQEEKKRNKIKKKRDLQPITNKGFKDNV